MALIYAVEDDKNILEIEMFALKNSGYQVEGFECARDFYKKLEEKQPDLVLLDIMLPEEDGLEVLKKIRSNTATKHLPVIMLTAKGTEYDQVIGLDCGADDFEADGDVFTVYTTPDDFNAVADALAAKKYSFVSAQIEMVPQNYVKLSAEDAEKMEKMLELFDDDDDVQNTWHNWDQD